MDTKKAIAMFLIVSSMLVVMPFSYHPDLKIENCVNTCVPQCEQQNPTANPVACINACTETCKKINHDRSQDPSSLVEKINALAKDKLH